MVYWTDLRNNPENGYALFGLWRSLQAQEKTEEAARLEERFATAWKRADVKLSTSRY